MNSVLCAGKESFLPDRKQITYEKAAEDVADWRWEKNALYAACAPIMLGGSGRKGRNCRKSRKTIMRAKKAATPMNSIEPQLNDELFFGKSWSLSALEQTSWKRSGRSAGHLPQ
jgi:hypothetical protein